VDDTERLTEALLEASRALVAVAARSLAQIGERLTLPEFRALVVLHRIGPLPVTVLAEHVGVHQSTATRIAARLRRRELVATDKGEQDRRLTVVRLSPAGASLVDDVFARRRADIAAVVARLPGDVTLGAHVALQAFAEELQRGAPRESGNVSSPATEAGTWAL
jgi:DNA-binding MarR family transcriptional regulator